MEASATKKIAAWLLICLLLSSMPACAEVPVVLTYAETADVETLPWQTAQVFKAAVEELTGGEVVINVMAPGVPNMLESLTAGNPAADIMRADASAMVRYGASGATLLTVPYLFVSHEHFCAFAESSLAAAYLVEPNALHARGLFYMEEGFRHFCFRSNVARPEDLAGLTLGAPATLAAADLAACFRMGAAAVPEADLALFLASGEVDGAELSLAAGMHHAWLTAAPYVLLDGHLLNCSEVIITQSAWERLDAAQQNALTEAGLCAARFSAAASAEMEAACMADMAAVGATFIPVADKAVWQDACRELIARYTAGLETDCQTIRSMAE